MHTELNPVKWTLAERQQFLEKGFRPRRMNEFPCSALVRPVDYAHDLARGEIEWMPGWRNYSLHSVTIPDGTTITECNFSQCRPGTAAIKGKSLKFVGCNLTNNTLDPTWALEACNTAQAWLVSIDGVDGQGKPTKFEKRQYICSHPSKLKAELPPVNAVLKRDF